MRTLFGFIAALLVSTSAHAIVFEVRGYNRELLYFQAYPMGDMVNVGRATVNFLDFGKSQGKITYTGDKNGIVMINGLGPKTEVNGNELRAYGWCYSVNGAIPDEMPNRVFAPDDWSRIEWFYAYGRQVDGEWREQCVPATR